MNGDPRIELAERLAGLLASEEGALLIARLQRQAVGRATATTVAPAPHQGALELQQSNAPAEAWRVSSGDGRFRAKDRPRVVLLGESVARGFFYDPTYTPALALEAMLPGVEVVDLARTDLGADELLTLFANVPALRPDAVVVFAGNNWNGVLLGPDDLGGVADVLRAGGYAAVRRVFMERLLAPRCAAALDRLAAIAREHELPVVLLVPEFNLGDWRAEADAVAPVLPGDGNAVWCAVRDEAVRARSDGRAEDAAALGARMFELDGGTSPLGHELLAGLALAQGRVDEARAQLEAARDAVCGIFAGHSPRCPRVVQDVLRRKADEHGFALVDVPRLFDELLEGALPDRRLFLDYCHLTEEGIAAAMAATARAVAPILGVEALSTEPALDDDARATAHLLAAVHCAHHGQSGELVRYHCTRAAAGGAPVRDLVELATGDGPPWASPAYARLCSSPVVARYLAPGRRLADHMLAETAAAAIGEQPDWHANGRVDLLDASASAQTFWELKGRTLGPARAFHRAPDTRSRFFLVHSRGPRRFELTARLPAAAGEAELAVNGAPIARLALDRAWRTLAFELRDGALRPGVNELAVLWPATAAPEDELERSARGLERGIFPAVYPSFGEIHAFTAG